LSTSAIAAIVENAGVATRPGAAQHGADGEGDVADLRTRPGGGDAGVEGDVEHRPLATGLAQERAEALTAFDVGGGEREADHAPSVVRDSLTGIVIGRVP
jgi:hypothetical protein